MAELMLSVNTLNWFSQHYEMALGKKRFRIELEDAEGSKYNLSLEGNISKEKIIKIVEFMELLNIESSGNDSDESDEFAARRPPTAVSVGERIWSLVEGNFPYGSFTSTDILELYEDQFSEPIKLSIISTYLSRYSDRGRLMRTRQGKEWVYKIARQPAVESFPSASPDLRP
ncbi:MAG TPA: hypothetical protein VNI77_11675 [Nitrososphaera sp.]|nr:hypothetical protein [Nitrososphaera sp.]